VAPLVVAQQVLWLRRDIDTTPMDVLKLVYLCHGWMLGYHNVGLIDEAVEAWTYGPVVPSLYHRYKVYGGGIVIGEPADQSGFLSPDMNVLVDHFVHLYRPFSPFQLSALTHQPDTPWDITRRRAGIGSVIPTELIRDHYRRLIDG
jgi:uncharacterized phage-associated protein